MRRKFLAAAVIAMILILAAPAFVLADTPSIAIKMQGQVVIIPGNQTEQIHLELKSDDAHGWFIYADLVVPVTSRNNGDERESDDEENSSYSGNSNTGVSGSFFIGVQTQTLTDGTVSGTLYANGIWEITLLGQDNVTSLNMVFTIQTSGAVISVVQGQWPLLPGAVTPPATTAVIPPAVPVTPPSSFVDVVPATAQEQPEAQTPASPQTPPVNNHLWWYISRTSAIAAYILLFISICLGIGLKTKYLDSMMVRWRSFDLHQFTSILAGALIILHIFSLLGDKYFNFSVSQLLVPMSSPYRPLWTALGSVALYAGAVIALSSFIRKMIGQKPWRILHYFSYLLFFIILFHGIMAGTDTSIAWMQWLYVSTGTFVVFLFLWRFLTYRPDTNPNHEKVRIGSLEHSRNNPVS